MFGVAARTDWETPPALFDALNGEFGFTLDAAANTANAKCSRFFTPDDDGLSEDWGTETVWPNPPYGPALPAWMAKAYEASTRGATVVCLVPARVDTRWWHEYAERGEHRFIRGRVKFVGATWTAPFPCAIVIFRPACSIKAVA